MKVRKLDAVDGAKWLCAWLVLLIHTGPVLPGMPLADDFLLWGVCRLAVPFFFGISAFLLFRKMGSDEKQNRKALWRGCRSFLWLYGVWSAVYIGYTLFYAWHHGEPLSPDWAVTTIRSFFLKGVHYHLWYLMSSVYALPVVYLLWRKGRKALVAGCLVGCLLCAAETVQMGFPAVSLPALTYFQDQLTLLHGAVLHAIPMMCMGALCVTDREKKSCRQWGLWFLLTFAAYCAEVAVWYGILRPQQGNDRLLLCVPAAYCMVNWLVSVRWRFPANWLGAALRAGSTWIYCVHPLMLLMYQWVFAREGLFRVAVVGAMSLISGIPYVVGKLLLSRRKAPSVPGG